MTTPSTANLAELSARAAEAAKLLRRLPGDAAELVRAARRATAAIENDWRLPPQQKAAGVAETRTKTKDGLWELEQARRRATATIEGYVERASARPHLGGDPALESQRTAAWQRIRDRLDHLAPNVPKTNVAMQLVAELEAAADTAALQAARRELPDYLKARGEELPAVIRRRLDAAAGPPEARQAAAWEESLGNGIYRTEVALGRVRHAFDAGNAEATFPGWADDEIHHVQFDSEE